MSVKKISEATKPSWMVGRTGLHPGIAYSIHRNGRLYYLGEHPGLFEMRTKKDMKKRQEIQHVLYWNGHWVELSDSLIVY